jgi:hypothetical protein
MSIRSKVFAAAATLTLVGGVGAVGALTAGTAGAATPSAGSNAVDFFSEGFGSFASPNFLLDTYKQGLQVGQPQILYRTANFDPALDYTIPDQGLVSAFATAGVLTTTLAGHYASDEAFQLEYSPYGVNSGLCTGVAATATAGETVTLQACLDNPRAVWIIDAANGNVTDTDTGAVAPLINGSDTDFIAPLVLTYPMYSYPTDMPRAGLYVTNLTGSVGVNSFPVLATVDDQQLWGEDTGPVMP